MARPSGSALQSLTELLLDRLFSPEHRRLNTSVILLQRKNNEILREEHDGFILNGEYFRPHPEVRRPRPPINPSLDLSLIDEGEAFLKDATQIKLDQQIIKQSLIHLLTPCESEQDIRDALPDCLKEMLTPTIANLRRTRPEAFTIQTNPRALRQFTKALPLMQVYSIVRLMY